MTCNPDTGLCPRCCHGKLILMFVKCDFLAFCPKQVTSVFGGPLAPFADGKLNLFGEIEEGLFCSTVHCCNNVSFQNQNIYCPSTFDQEICFVVHSNI